MLLLSCIRFVREVLRKWNIRRLATKFYLWSPTAEEVRLMLYDAGEGGHAYETVKMEPTEDGTWTTSVDENLLANSMPSM